MISCSFEETIELGRQFGKTLKSGSLILFRGDLAAGKTTFIKGVAEGFADYQLHDVNSPTFVYLNIYEGSKTVYHFDLYRLKDGDEFVRMGFDEYFYSDGICCIEWSERISSLDISFDYLVDLEHIEETRRKIRIQSP